MEWSISLSSDDTGEEIPYNEVDLPIVTATPDALSRGGLRLIELRAVVKPPTNTHGTPTGTIKRVKAAVLRRSAMVTPTAPLDALEGEPVAGQPFTYRLVKLQDFVSGTDNELVVWVRVEEPTGSGTLTTKVFRRPIEVRIKNSRSLAIKTRLLHSALNFNRESGVALVVPPEMGGSEEAAIGLNWLQAGRLDFAAGTVRVDNPAESEPVPQDVLLAPLLPMPMLQLPLYAVTNVSGGFAGGTLTVVRLLVLRADEQIPLTPTGSLVPATGQITFDSTGGGSSGTFVAHNVPGAVKGLDNKLVVWGQFQNDSIPIRVVRRFNGV